MAIEKTKGSFSEAREIFSDPYSRIMHKNAILIDLSNSNRAEEIHQVKEIGEGFPLESLLELYYLVREKFKKHGGLPTYFGRSQIKDFSFIFYSLNPDCIIAEEENFYFSFSR